MTLELSLCCDNRDIVRPLLDGEVSPEGIELTPLVQHPPVRHRRFFRNMEFDVCEVSLASYLSSRADREQYPATAIPVYPSKKFRHSFLYTHADADVGEPADLAGKKVGIQSWQTTANVWLRGILREHYDLDLAAVEWYRRREDDVPISVPDRFDVRPVPGAQEGDGVERPVDLQEMLFSGDLDAAMDPSTALFEAVADARTVDLLFDDPLAEERAYFEETGIHPPMHLVAIRDEILDAEPWVANSLLDAFREARDRALDPGAGEYTSLTWSHLHFRRQREALGPNIWDYGLTEQTRRELRTFVGYAHNQGLVPREYELSELFADPVLEG
jgi:4,5-dihydroxyphthalate decarboxylase